MKTLTAEQITRINRELTLALIGVRKKNRLHIEKALELLNENRFLNKSRYRGRTCLPSGLNVHT